MRLNLTVCGNVKRHVDASPIHNEKKKVDSPLSSLKHLEAPLSTLKKKKMFFAPEAPSLAVILFIFFR